MDSSVRMAVIRNSVRPSGIEWTGYLDGGPDSIGADQAWR